MIDSIYHFLATTPFTDYRIVIILITVAAIVGFVNTIAGMATALSYGLFMSMGMPINIANGTTRVGVLLQFITNTLIFKKKGALDVKKGIEVGVPVGIGAIFGAVLVAILQVKIIELVMAVVLPVMSVFLFVDLKGNKLQKDIDKMASFTWWKFLSFTLIGVYGGFTHSGVGLLVMFGCVFMLGLNMLQANAIKQFAVSVYTPLALAVFIIYGQVNWGVALIYAIGNIIGGVLGSYVSIKGSEKFVKAFIAVIIVIMSIVLIFKNL